MLEMTKRSAGRPRKWENTIQTTCRMGEDDLALITQAAEATGQSMSSFLVSCALAEARALTAAANRQPTASDALNLRDQMIG